MNFDSSKEFDIAETTPADPSNLVEAFNCLPSGVLVVSYSGTIRFANDSAAKLLTTPIEELIGNTCYLPIGNHSCLHLEVERKDGPQRHLKLEYSDLTWDNEPHYLITISSQLSSNQADESKSLKRAVDSNLFSERATHAIRLADQEQHCILVMVLRVSGINRIAQLHGVAFSNKLYALAEKTLNTHLGVDRDLICLPNQEFALLLPEINSRDEAEQQVEELLRTTNTLVNIDGYEIPLGFLIGASLFPDDGETAELLLKRAEIALFHARRQQEYKATFFNPEHDKKYAQRLRMGVELDNAINDNELVLHYQPIFDLKTGAIIAAEALVRWNNPGKGLVPPSEFIPLAEENGSISRIGRWVLEDVCKQLTIWKESTSPVPIAINVSAVELKDKTFAKKFIQCLESFEINPNLITIEITESAILEYREEVARTLQQFKNAGIKIAIDDFGTGYSCLAYLKKLPLDILKIDRSFVTDLVSDPNDTAIVSTVISMAHRLGMQVIAEGVESEAQHHFLSVRECDYLQGFRFSKPVPADDFEALLNNDVNAPVFQDCQDRNLLLVDDNRNTLNSLRRLLRNSGYRILEAETISDALTILASNDIHVVVAEQVMESAQATQFLGKVRDLYPLTVRILLTGYTKLDTVISSINNGSIYKFIAKPWDDQELRETISEAFSLSDRLRRGDLITRRSESLMSTARLFWSEDFTMGCDHIDLQHQQLFEFHNRLNDTAWSTLPTPDIKQTLADLTALVKRHFSDEEKMMSKINYPALTIHQREHQEFLRRLEWLSRRSNVAERTMLIDLTSFVRTWLTEHVELYDMAAARYASSLQEE